MKLYVLTRRDLSTSQQGVQAGHAVAEFLLRGPKTEWDNGTLVYLGVRDEQTLEIWKDKLSFRNIPYVHFQEPDRNHETTAIATVCNDRIFRSLRLL